MILLLLAVTLSSKPQFLRPDTDARAVVRIQCDSEPLLSVNAGRFEKLHRVADDAFEADYLPPEEPIPRVAIATAVAAGKFGWLAIPLWGAGDALVKTRKHAQISVQIGDQTFGPAEADAEGDALVPVIVPPGVNEAFHGKRAIDLHVPKTQTLQLALGAQRLLADRAQVVQLFVAVVTPKGEPRRDAQLSIGATRGEVSAPRETAPGLYEAKLTIPAGLIGQVVVRAALTDAPKFVSQASIALEPGPAKTVSLIGEATRAVAGESPVSLTASARDAAGNASPEKLKFEASFGTVAANAASVGQWLVTVTLPPEFKGKKSVDIVVRGEKARDAKTLPLLPAAPSKVTFSDSPRTVRADGHSAIRVPLQVSDDFGNPAQATPRISANQGTAALESNGGALYASYVPPLLHEPSQAMLAAKLGGSTANAELLLMPQLRPAAFSPKIGFLSNFDGFSAPFVGIEAALRSERFGPQLGLALEVDATRRSQDATLDETGQVSTQVSILLFHLSAQYRHEWDARTTLWLAAGPSLAGYLVDVSGSKTGSLSNSAFSPGAHAAVGVERRMGFAVPFLELRATWITRPELPTVSGPLRILSLGVGARFEAL
ncbi:MAG TPA: hypothetical protein VH083_25150 [Myxococcales bacterium]|nr:hypothetical protein [Myxococcales bacterium]